jgi:hypothetical protein
MKHTRGPFRYDPAASAIVGQRRDCDLPLCIASLYTPIDADDPQDRIEERHANGALFEAAPVMLAKLKEALTAWPESFDGDKPLQSCADVVEWFTEWREGAKAVIAAAEGR